MARTPIAAQIVAQIIVDRLTSYWLQPAIARDAVPVVVISGGLFGDVEIGKAAGQKSGRRIMRLEYDWRELEAHVYRTVDEFSRDVLPTLTSDGAIIRARMRYERSRGAKTA